MTTSYENGEGDPLVENPSTSIGAVFAASKFIAKASRNRRYAHSAMICVLLLLCDVKMRVLHVMERNIPR